MSLPYQPVDYAQALERPVTGVGLGLMCGDGAAPHPRSRCARR